MKTNPLFLTSKVKFNFILLFTIIIVVFILFSSAFNILAFSEKKQLMSQINKIFYIDSIFGDDKNSGISISEPWRSIFKLEQETNNIVPGDKILFKRGCVWNDYVLVKNSGMKNNNIYYGAYGNGNYPLFDLNNITKPAFFVSASYITLENISIMNTGNQGMIFENTQYGVYGIKINNINIFNTNSNGILHGRGGGDIIIENVTINKTKNAGIAIMGSTVRKIHDVMIKNCFISNCYDGITIHEGNSTSMTSAGENFTLINNHCEYNKEQGFDITSGNNILLLNNTSFNNNLGSIVIGHSASNVTIVSHHAKNEPIATNTGGTVGIFVNNVTIMNSIFEGGNNHMVLLYPVHSKEIGNINIYNNLFVWTEGDLIQSTGLSSINCLNNIFYSLKSRIGLIKFADENHKPDDPNYKFDNNLYYCGGEVEFWHRNDGIFNFYQFQSRYGQEKNGYSQDPGFLNPKNGIYKPSWNSILIDNGFDFKKNIDIESNNIYGIRDIGPFEFVPINDIVNDRIVECGKIIIYEDYKYRYENKINNQGNINITIVPLNESMYDVKKKIMELFTIDFEYEGNNKDYLFWTENHFNERKGYLYKIGSLKPNSHYSIVINNKIFKNIQTNMLGYLEFYCNNSENFVEFQIIQQEFPIIFHLNNKINVSTGEQAKIDVRVTDNNGIETVELEYWYEEKTNHIKIPMKLLQGTPQDGLWNANVEIPSFLIGKFYYRVIAKDIDNNIVQSQSKVIEIVDNDPPFIISENVDEKCISGELFDVILQVEDNIKVATGKIEFFINEKYGYSQLNYLEGLYYGQISIPNVIGNFTYWFKITDDAGNILNTSKKIISIIDNKNPILIKDLTLNFAVINNKFIFNVYVLDNVDIKEVFVEYIPMDGEITTIKMAKISDNYLYNSSIIVKSEYGKFFLYRYIIIDTSENKFITNFKNVEININNEYLKSSLILYPEKNNTIKNNTEIISYIYWEENVVIQKIVANNIILATLEKPMDEMSNIFLYKWDTNNYDDGIYFLRIQLFNSEKIILSETDNITVYIKNNPITIYNFYIIISPEINKISIRDTIKFNFQIYDTKSNEIIRIFNNYEWFIIEGTGMISKEGIFIPITTGNVTLQISISINDVEIFQNISFTVISETDSSDQKNRTFLTSNYIIILINVIIIIIGIIVFFVYRKNKSINTKNLNENKTMMFPKYSKIVIRTLKKNEE